MLAAELGAHPDVSPIDHEAITKPERHPDDLEALAKVLLLITADIDPDAVTSAIDGAGNKQLILGGAELVALAVLIVGGLQVIISRGKTSEHVEIIVERDSNGEEHIVGIGRTTHYGTRARWPASSEDSYQEIPRTPRSTSKGSRDRLQGSRNVL